MFQPRETFGVAHHEVATGHEASEELGNQFFLSGAIEVDHDISAEDDMEGFCERRLTVQKVEVLKRDAVAQGCLRAVIAVVPNTPNCWNVLTSAWMHAPPPLSLPAIVSATARSSIVFMAVT